MKITSLGELVRHLTEKGDKDFRDAYPNAFLLVSYLPENGEYDFDQATLNTQTQRLDEKRVKSLARATLDDLVIEVAKGGKNIFKSKIMLGRAPTSDINLRGPKISKLHCAFVREDDGTYRLVDMGSLNGTVLNGRLLTKDLPVQLKDGDHIHVWEYQFVFVLPGTLMSMLRHLANAAMEGFT